MDSGAAQNENYNGQMINNIKSTILLTLKWLTRSTQQLTEDVEGVLESLFIRHLLKWPEKKREREKKHFKKDTKHEGAAATKTKEICPSCLHRF